MATPKSPSKDKRDMRLELADRLIEQIEKGEARWQRPWAAGEFQPPVNAITGKPYRGVNYENLATFSPDNSDPRWCTYKQAQEAGWQVRKGAKGVPIEFWGSYEAKRTDEQKEAIREGRKGAGVEDDQVADKEQRRFARYYTVFHASQIDGIPPIERPAQEHVIEGDPDQRLAGLAENMGVDVTHSGGNKAFYRPSEDRVYLPPVANFETATGHDTTLLHELSHATGHEKRLNREGITNSDGFGSRQYAMEELRAEMSAAMTAAKLGIGFDPKAQDMEEGREAQNTAAYLASWLKALPEKERKQELMAAIKDAQGISDYLIERTPEIEVAKEQTQEVAKEQAAPAWSMPYDMVQRRVQVSALKGAEMRDGKVLDSETVTGKLIGGYDKSRVVAIVPLGETEPRAYASEEYVDSDGKSLAVGAESLRNYKGQIVTLGATADGRLVADPSPEKLHERLRAMVKEPEKARPVVAMPPKAKSKSQGISL